jgi:hypothetical protein
MTAEEKKVIELVEKQFNEGGYESVINETDGLEVLRVLLDELGEKGDESAIIEFCFMPLGDDREGIPEDLRLFQIFTTLVGDIDEAKIPDILVKLNKANLECVLGSFNIFEEERQMYHRYISIVRGDTAEEMMKVIQPAVNWVGATVIENYDEMKSLCS